MSEPAPRSPLLNRDDASSDGGDAGTSGLGALARCATGGALSSLLTGELDRLTKDNERLQGLLRLQASVIKETRTELASAKQTDDAVVDTLKKELAEERRSTKRAHAEIRRLTSQESAARKSAKGIAYSAILATVPVGPHDRVLIRYTHPKGLVAVGSVQPRPHDENPTGVNIRASVCEFDGEIMEAVVCADCVTPITQFNVEDVLPMVVSKENLKRMADRAKGKQESLPLFGERVLRQTVADLKASNLLKDHLHLVEAAEALIVLP